MSTTSPAGELPNMAQFPEPDLEQIADDFTTAVKDIEILRGTSIDELVFHGPSRNLVASDPGGTFFVKHSIDPVRFDNELDNLAKFHRINEERRDIFRSVVGGNQPYIGLPTIDSNLLDARGVSGESRSGRGGLYFFDAVQGDLLYDRILSGKATFDDFALAAVQMARIMQEGKLHQVSLGLRPVGECYYTDRFVSNFLGQLINYGGVHISEEDQEIMSGNWSVLVDTALTETQKRGHDGMYFDGQPKHHIYPTPISIVSLDFEDKDMTSTLLGLASLLSNGQVKKDGTPYVTRKDQYAILDRFLLELEFVEALDNGYDEKASRVLKHVRDNSNGNHEFISSNINHNIYLVLGGSGDRRVGHRYRQDFLSAWPYALLQRDAEWTGHKGRYRAVAPILIERGIRFQIPDPVQQNAAEQREHLRNLIYNLDKLANELPVINGTHQPKVAARTLHDKMTALQANNQQYFNPTK